MNNDFKKNNFHNMMLNPDNENLYEASIESMWAEFLHKKSNNAKIKNKYFSCIKALKNFVNTT